jgi:Domain of Unknown Function (DUF928)
MAILRPITSAISLGLVLSIALPAIAAYKPRNRRPPIGKITHTGTRDDCNSQRLLVKPLAPPDHIAEFGQNTKKTTPLNLAWSISNPQSATALNLEVDLYRLGTTQAFVTTLPITKLANNRWIATIDQPLKPGFYAWHLSNTCGASPSKITAVEFEISPLPTEVETAIDQAKNPEQRSQIYAEAGFWYNAVDAAVKSDRPNTLSDLLKE